MNLSILNIFDPEGRKTLKKECADVATISSQTRELCQDMVETMFAQNGVGLAAPQVGKNLNIFVMRTMKGIEQDTRDHIVLINPFTIIEVGGPLVAQEGCLSIPGLFADVERYSEVGCVYWTLDGNRIGAHFSGFQARIYQHEYDHLQGVLFIERMIKGTEKISKKK